MALATSAAMIPKSRSFSTYTRSHAMSDSHAMSFGVLADVISDNMELYVTSFTALVLGSLACISSVGRIDDHVAISFFSSFPVALISSTPRAFPIEFLSPHAISNFEVAIKSRGAGVIYPIDPSHHIFRKATSSVIQSFLRPRFTIVAIPPAIVSENRSS